MHLSTSTLLIGIAGLIGGNFSNTTEVSIIDNQFDNGQQVFEFLYKINEGKRIIKDYCEMLEIDESMFNMNSITKPECLNNHSFIDSNNSVSMFRIDEDLRKFFIEQKKNFCNKEDIICGELTILIKLYDLIQGAQDILLTDLNNNNIWLNLKIIDFENLYNLYVVSMDNIELLTNITLKRTRANVYLEREKTRLSKELNMEIYERFINSVNYYIGQPIKDTVNYTTESVVELFTNTISNIMPSLSLESKIIIGILCFLLIRTKI